MLEGAEEDKDVLAQVDVKLYGKIVARDGPSEDYQVPKLTEDFVALLNKVDLDINRSHGDCNLEQSRGDLASGDDLGDVKLKKLDHLDVVLLSVAGGVQSDDVLELLQGLLMPVSESDLEMLVGLDADLNGAVDGNMTMTLLLAASRNDGDIKLGESLLDRVDSSLGDSSRSRLGGGSPLDHLLIDSDRLMDMLLMLLTHLSERYQSQDVSMGFPTTGSLDNLLVLDRDLVEDRKLNLDVDLENVGVLLIDLTDYLLGPLVLSVMVTDSLPHESTKFTELNPHAAAVVVTAKEETSLKGIVVTVLDTLVQDSDDLKIVLVHVFVADQLTVVSQLVQGPDGQAMSVTKMLLVSLKDLNVELNHLLMSVVFLVELNKNRERITEQLILKTTRGQASTVDAKVNELSLLKVTLVMVALGETTSDMDAFSDRMLRESYADISAQDGLPSDLEGALDDNFSLRPAMILEVDTDESHAS